MSGIDREIYLETRTSLIDKHLPGTEKSQRELETEGIVYLFSDRETMERVASEIFKRGERTGAEDIGDKYERYGLLFAEPIGYILKRVRVWRPNPYWTAFPNIDGKILFSKSESSLCTEERYSCR